LCTVDCGVHVDDLDVEDGPVLGAICEVSHRPPRWPSMAQYRAGIDGSPNFQSNREP
jgi:hypothetical protein